MDNIAITTSRQAHLAMPSSRGAQGARPWALVFKGEVSVFGAGVTGDVRPATADVRTVPGTPAWSPPI